MRRTPDPAATLGQETQASDIGVVTNILKQTCGNPCGRRVVVCEGHTQVRAPPLRVQLRGLGHHKERLGAD